MRQHHLSNIALFLSLCLNCTAVTPAIGGSGGDNEYDVKKIDPSLMKDADAVIRVDIVRFEVKNKERAVEKVKRAITVFNKEGRHYGELFLIYDKFTEIKKIKGIIYDANGEEIRDLDADEIGDAYLVSGYASFADEKAKSAKLYYDNYPYTIEFKYEIEYNESLGWPKWISQRTLDPAELNRFEVAGRTEDSIRYWCSNDTVNPVVTIDGSEIEYVWECRNLPKLSRDMVGGNTEETATTVFIAPSGFSIEDYSGDMKTWKSFGLWAYGLYRDRDKLTDSVRSYINSLLKPGDTIRDKVQKLYEYMQSRTRYVSIQLGIGGWQPFEAVFVHEHGYGDCKALSNYMVAILNAAGIKAYPVLINPGMNRFPFIEEFPSNQFNHVIVCVPAEEDTFWLECTSQSMPFGHVGYKNENRKALVISPEGGIVVNIPQTCSRENEQQQRAVVRLNAFGHAVSHIDIIRNGDQQDGIRSAMYQTSPMEREKWILNNLDIANFNLKNYTIDGLESHEQTIRLALDAEITKCASISGNRMFFQPNLLEKHTYIPPQVSRRLAPVRFAFPYLDSDSIHYYIPEGFTIESVPKETHLQTSFGEYDARTVAFGDTVVLYIRSMNIRDYMIPPEKYAEYRQFYSDMVKADRMQVVLRRK